jgi:hypothetical protein
MPLAKGSQPAILNSANDIDGDGQNRTEKQQEQ